MAFCDDGFSILWEPSFCAMIFSKTSADTKMIIYVYFFTFTLFIYKCKKGLMFFSFSLFSTWFHDAICEVLLLLLLLLLLAICE